ncbi:MAG: DUF5615 family PIN-like protein [Acidobacteria bacterium]|nr:DUF5615 family PIN-like protein [Acidobacteriota bacterium]
MRFVIDMNLTPRWAGFLLAAGHEAWHWSQVGPATATDEHICAWARSMDAVVLTNDLDFPQILAHTRESGPSVILLRGEPLTPEVRGASLRLVIENRREMIEQGAIATITWDGQIRVRVLPLGRKAE